MTTLSRYLHTVRYLKPEQIAARIWFRYHRPRPDPRPAPPRRRARGAYCAPIAPTPSMTGPDAFRFLNVERRCAQAADWNPADAALLWTYHLHYFDDLNAVDAARRVAWHESLLQRWVAENPPASGPGWDPYPVSRRIVNWVKWAARGNALRPALADSLATQARWLEKRLEYHILGNHLFANACALVHAGVFFDGEEAGRWLARGLAILARQTGEQILPDGAHFELSTMYQALVLEGLLDLINVMICYGQAVPADWSSRAARMQVWLDTLTHPDGQISFFNDAAFNAAPSPRELSDYAARLGVPRSEACNQSVVVLENSGYVRATQPEVCLLCDCAPIGPDYLPGHAHADTLSFELSIGGQRVFVNSGTSEYGTGPERHRQRGTAAHNTVVVDGANSSEVWGGFRVARRARARLNEARGGATAVVEASHDGYTRLPGRNVHRRRWTLAPEELAIEDEVSGPARTLESFFHLHPDVTASQSGTTDVKLHWQGGAGARLSFDGATAVELRAGSWHPEFGRALASVAIVVRFAGPRLGTRLEWGRGA